MNFFSIHTDSHYALLTLSRQTGFISHPLIGF
jgi:hypothetical protein